MQQPKTNIGDIIRSKRIAAGLTQRSLGEALGYDRINAQHYVAKWEAGTRPVPRDKIRAVARLLDLDPVDLIP